MPSSLRACFRRARAVGLAGALLVDAGIGHAGEPLSNPGTRDSAEPAARAQRSFDDARERVVLLIRTAGDDGVITPFRAEVLRSHWRVLELRLDERFEPAPLGRIAEQQGAAAAVRVDTKTSSVELWVSQAEGSVEERISAEVTPARDHVLALRAAEALRARGLLLGPDASPAPATASANPRDQRDTPAPLAENERDRGTPGARDASPTIWFDLGPGLAVSPGGVGPLTLAELGFHLEFGGSFSSGLVGLVPLSRPSVVRTEGEAEIGTWLLGGVLEHDWLELGSVRLRAGIGGGVIATTMTGDARAGYSGAHDTVVSFAPLGRCSFHIALARAFRLRAGASLGLSIPTVRIAFAERQVADWGRPFVVASIALEATPAP